MTIASQLEFSGLAPASGAADVEISLDAIPQTAEVSWTRGGCYAVLGDQYLLDIPGVARYLVERGNRIVIEPLGTDESGLRAFLFGPVFGVLFFQRSVLAFSASAFETARGAVLLVGASASGKSTAAAVFAQRGYRLLADGLCVVCAVRGKFFVLPGLPTLQLWADALLHLGIAERDAKPWRAGVRKYAVPAPRHCPDSLPLAAVYGLATTNCTQPWLQSVRGFDKCSVLAESTHSRRFLGGSDPSGMYFRQVLQLGAEVPVKRLARPDRAGHYAAVVDLMERDMSA